MEDYTTALDLKKNILRAGSSHTQVLAGNNHAFLLVQLIGCEENVESVFPYMHKNIP